MSTRPDWSEWILQKNNEAKQEELNKSESCLVKSNYGPKKANLYNIADNVNRKINNVGDVAGSGKNQNVKSFSSKPGQLSSKQQASLEAKKAKKLSGPIKVFTPEEIEEYKKKRSA